MPKLKEELVAYFKALGYSQSLVYLLCLKHDLDCSLPEEQFQFLVKNNFIKRNILENKIVCTISLYEGEEIEFDNNLSEIVKISLDIEERVDEYRKLFKYPQIRSGMMGNKETCKEYLLRWCKENKKSMEEVISITSVYIGYTDIKYLPNADNFIYQIKDGKEISKLTMAAEEQSLDGYNTRTWEKVI
jgi:hypothetical protein